MNNYDIVIVGAGPAGIFTAYELLEKKFQGKILIIEKGHDIEKRHCPKDKTGKCVKCEPCAITTGFSGAGAFSDGKLSLSPEVGGDLPDLIGYDTVKELIDYTDKIYLKFHADKHVEGISDTETIREIRKKAISANLKLVECPVRHLGTEKAHELYTYIQRHLLYYGVEIMFDTECIGIRKFEDKEGFSVHIKNSKHEELIEAKKLILATGLSAKPIL